MTLRQDGVRMKGFQKPQAVVLPESAMVPPGNSVSPSPNRFTHRVTEAAPFFYGTAAEGSVADGELAAGTRVVLMVESGARSRVVSENGLYVDVETGRLEPL